MGLHAKRILKTVLLILSVCFVFSLILGYLYFLDLKKTFITRVDEKVTAVIGQTFRIGDLSLSLSGGINLYDITIQNPDGFPVGELLRMKRVHLDVSLRELLEDVFSFRKIVLYSPQLTLARNKEGGWNISDRLMHSLSGKGTARWQVEELRIDSGQFDLNGDARFRMEDINLLFRNLSSDPGVRTEMEGSTAYGGNRVSLTGWVSLNEKPRKALLVLSSKDVTLNAFRKSLEPYRIDTEKIRMDMEFRAEGDTEKGFHITSMIRVNQLEFALMPKELKEIFLRADMAFRLDDRSLIVNAARLEARGIAATLKGELIDLQGDPSYRAEISIDGMDLSLLHFLKDLRISGKLVSDQYSRERDSQNKVPRNVGGAAVERGQAGILSWGHRKDRDTPYIFA